jgi:flagellar biogenesis protein FliO
MRSFTIVLLLVLVTESNAQDVRRAGYEAPLSGMNAPSTPPAQPRIPLSRPSNGSRDDNSSAVNTLSRPASVPRSALTVLGSLGIVVGLFFVGAWVMRRGMPTSTQRLPIDVFESLGRVPLSKGQHAQLLKLGNKIVLVSISATGTDTITEVNDPDEVERIAAACRTSQHTEAPETFRRLYERFAGNKTSYATTQRSRIAGGIDDGETADA